MERGVTKTCRSAGPAGHSWMRSIFLAVVAVVAPTSGRATTGLVAAFSFDEGSGSTVTDLSGAGNAGTLSNATWTSAGKYGSVLSFNGTNARVNNRRPSRAGRVEHDIGRERSVRVARCRLRERTQSSFPGLSALFPGGSDRQARSPSQSSWQPSRRSARTL